MDAEILRYISYIILPLILGFILAAVGGKIILPQLNKLQVGQKVREVGPKTHYKKSGTPTFGGAIFLFAFTLLAIISLIIDFRADFFAILLFILAHAAIGFVDDFVKVRINKKGLSARAKTLYLLIVQVVFVAIYLFALVGPVRMVLPFSMGVWTITGVWKVLYGLFLIFYFYACTNAVNITDGVDGLATTVSVVTLTFLTLHVLWHPTSPGANHSLWFASSLSGALMGFLLYNWHKAKVFMGDFGSLAIGAAIAVLFLREEVPLAFVLAGVIYVIEIGSVFIQVQYFRRTGGKRIFRMSPIHHHYELGGWKEEKVVFSFALVQLIGSIVAALIFWPSLR